MQVYYISTRQGIVWVESMLFPQFEECLYIAVNGDGEETDDDLKRKIFVMKKFTEILFGMVTLSSSLLRKE